MFLLFLASCISSNQVYVQRQAIQAYHGETLRYFVSPDAWQFSTAAADARVKIRDGLGVRIERTWNVQDAHIVLQAAPAELCTGTRIARTNSCGSILLCANKTQSWLTIAHEFGHSLGMQHVTDGPAVMNPNMSRVASITQRDRLAYTNRYERFSVFAEQCQELVRD